VDLPNHRGQLLDMFSLALGNVLVQGFNNMILSSLSYPLLCFIYKSHRHIQNPKGLGIVIAHEIKLLLMKFKYIVVISFDTY
jgi:hypothetical protein